MNKETELPETAPAIASSDLLADLHPMNVLRGIGARGNINGLDYAVIAGNMAGLESVWSRLMGAIKLDQAKCQEVVLMSASTLPTANHQADRQPR